MPRRHWLKEVDQAPEKSNIRRQKDKFLREMGVVYQDLQGLFTDSSLEKAQQAVKPFGKTELEQSADGKHRKDGLNEALRMYRLLRPDAPRFYEEDAMLAMQAKANKLLEEEAPAQKDALQQSWRQRRDGGEGGEMFDPFKAYLPVVNQRAFLLALESVIASLADDLETMCILAGYDPSLGPDHPRSLPAKDDPLRFKLLLDRLFGAFPLQKDPRRVEEFMDEYWIPLSNLLPEEFSRLGRDEVADWLRGHLRRVKLNQQRHAPKIFLHSNSARFGDEEMYNFAEDFAYDFDPMPGEFADERNLDFPLEKAADFMRSLLGALGQSPRAMQVEEAELRAGESLGDADVASQFQDLVWDLEKVGLRNWLRMDVGDLERFLPRGELADLRLGAERAKGVIPIMEGDVEVAKLMLRCAARGRADLLDFEAVDPYKLLHGLPAREVDNELAALAGHPHISDDALAGLVDEHTQRLASRHGGGGGAAEATAASRRNMDEWVGQGATIQDIYRKEFEFYRTAGPVEWTKSPGESPEEDAWSWKWRQPPNTFWDERRKVYIQEQKGVDPNLNLKEMRQHLLDMTRMGSMVKTGRINYFRGIVVVGNGKGIYGFGVGFGNSPKEARADASVKALQNLDYIDMDSGRMLCTPCHAIEYKHTATIIPRPLGRGIKANKKFLPLLYILGLDNCKVKFMHAKWFTRMRALKRALDMVISRRTLANMTGKRYALLVAPGDHWVHWPDRWFEQIKATHDGKEKEMKLKRKHILHFKTRTNKLAQTREVKAGWVKENWIRWSNPLERWLQHRRKHLPSNFDPDKSKDPPLSAPSAGAAPRPGPEARHAPAANQDGLLSAPSAGAAPRPEA